MRSHCLEGLTFVLERTRPESVGSRQQNFKVFLLQRGVSCSGQAGAKDAVSGSATRETIQRRITDSLGIVRRHQWVVMPGHRNWGGEDEDDGEGDGECEAVIRMTLRLPTRIHG